MSALTGSIVTLTNGNTGIRVDGVAAVGVRVNVAASRVNGAVVEVIWSGIAKDGRRASLVRLGDFREFRAPSRGYGPGRAGTDAYDNF